MFLKIHEGLRISFTLSPFCDLFTFNVSFSIWSMKTFFKLKTVVNQFYMKKHSTVPVFWIMKFIALHVSSGQICLVFPVAGILIGETLHCWRGCFTQCLGFDSWCPGIHSHLGGPRRGRSKAQLPWTLWLLHDLAPTHLSVCPGPPSLNPIFSFSFHSFPLSTILILLLRRYLWALPLGEVLFLHRFSQLLIKWEEM